MEKLIRKEAGESIEEDEESDLGEETELIGDHKGGNKKTESKPESETQEEEKSELKEDENQAHVRFSEKHDYELRKDRNEEEQEEKSKNIKSRLTEDGTLEKSGEDSEIKNQEHEEVKMIDEQLNQSNDNNYDLKNPKKSKDRYNEVEEGEPSRMNKDELKDDDTEESISNASNSNDNNADYPEDNTIVNYQNKHHRYNSEHHEKLQREDMDSDTVIIEGENSDYNHKTFKDKESDLDEDEHVDKTQEKTGERDSHIEVFSPEEQQEKSTDGQLVVKELAIADEKKSKDNDGYLEKGEETISLTRITT